jgi:pantetheine-phosphate adenylyltransferase
MLPLCDHLIIAVGVNSQKRSYFSIESRLAHIRSHFSGDKNISVETYRGLTTVFCKEKGASYLIRGLRNGLDAEFEKGIAQMNMKLAGIETVFVMTSPEYGAISSTIVREIRSNGGDITAFVTNPELLVIDTGS